jgi:hypothetical protein
MASILELFMRLPRLRIILLVAFGALAGCGDGRLKPVHGKVHFPDGEPLMHGKVVLSSVDGLHGASSGPLTADGSFALSSFQPGDGLPPGKYAVSLVGAVEPTAGEAAGSAPKYLIDPRFLDPAKSELTFEVTREGENFLDITVVKPPKP